MENYILNGIDGDLAGAQAALMKVAKNNGVSLDTVRSEISIAIKEAMTSGDAHAKALWANCPRSGEFPTPEEAIAYISGMVK